MKNIGKIQKQKDLNKLFSKKDEIKKEIEQLQNKLENIDFCINSFI